MKRARLRALIHSGIIDTFSEISIEMKRARLRALIHPPPNPSSHIPLHRNEESPFKAIDTLYDYFIFINLTHRNEESPFKGIDTE